MRTRILLPAFAGTFMVLLDLTIVAVALPRIQHDLRTGLDGLQWIVDAYSIALAVCLLSGGALGDRYGRKRCFLLGLAGFLAGSLVCAVAPSIGVLVAGRVLQGVSAALVVPGALAIIAQAAPDPAKRARLLGYWGLAASVAVLAGPILGGLLVDAFGWPSIFLVNLPICVVAIGVGLPTIVESADPEHAALDPIGQVLAVCALGSLVFAVIDAREAGWTSAQTLGLFAAAALCGIAFVVVESRKKRPMLPISLFGNGGFSVVNIASVLLGFGANGAFVLLSVVLQQSNGNSALVTGFLLAPMSLAIIPSSLLAGRLTAAYGPRLPMLLGYTATSLSLLGLGIVGLRSYALVAVLFVICGIGQGLAISPAIAAVLQHVPRERAGVGSAIVNTARQVGGALGIAVLGTVLGSFARYDAGVHALLLVAGCGVTLGAILLAVVRQDQPRRTRSTKDSAVLARR
ncbi:DHA2 family efflux MFS transporter permease subunit [Fodinicola acaciae]|uniref:DHA2 family efflux MFS transporter permease subunit n=1 Tax=Fodinicola acaciae TaxID=2681555 RepID=UPI0013D29C53|nr:DHA2 family efflux MFS transporter permease subunit [Fodinicola acaciae]